MNFTEEYFTYYIPLSEQRTQSKIHGGFVTFYHIHFSQLKCDTQGYSKPARKDYTIKLKRNGIMKLPNYLDIEENVVLHFLRLPQEGYHTFPYFKVNN